MEPPYSTAFEKLVRATETPGEEDLIGLLAYAYYKRDKRDLARAGDLSTEHLRDHHKTLTPGALDRYRESALRRLEDYGESVVSKVEPEIQESTRVEAINTARDEIIRVVEGKASPFTAILWNVIAWVITLGITFLVVVSYGRVTLNVTSP